MTLQGRLFVIIVFFGCSVAFSQLIGLPNAPPLPPQSLSNSITSTSMGISWPRGDDATTLHPTDWFEVQTRELGSQADSGWQTIQNGDKVGAPKAARREGQHEVQIISIRADRGEKITWGTFQLAFSFGGVNYLERYTDGGHTTNDTAVITAPIPWDASASQLKEALEGLDPIHRVQVRRCDESGGLGGSGGWLGGCPYRNRNGFSWEVIFEPVYYENELNSQTNRYQKHGEHKYIDEQPLSKTKSLQSEIFTNNNIESVIISNVDPMTNTLYLETLPSFNIVPGMFLVLMKNSTSPSSPSLNSHLPLMLTTVEMKSSLSFTISAKVWLSTSMIGQELLIAPHWLPQYQSELITSTEGNLPQLILYKETISQRTRWSGGGAMVKVEGDARSRLHSSACSPVNFAPSTNIELPSYRYQLSQLRGSCFLSAENLKSGTSYAFRVRAHNAQGWGPYSKVSQYTSTLSQNPPSAPVAPLFAGSTQTSITVYVGYHVEKDDGVGNKMKNERDNNEVSLQVESIESPGQWVTVQTLPKANTLTVYGLPNNGTYRFRSSVSNSLGTSPWSSGSLPMKLQSSLPSVPTAPLVTEPTMNSLRLSWLPQILSSSSSSTSSLVLEHEIQIKKYPNDFFENLPSSSLSSSIVSNVDKLGMSQVLQVTVQCDKTALVNDGNFWLTLTAATHVAQDSIVNDTYSNLNGFVGASSTSAVGDPMRSSVTPALRFDASAQQVREAIQDLVSMRANSVHVVRMSPSQQDTSNQQSFNGAYSWRITIKPPAHLVNGWIPPKLSILKDTIAECAHVDANSGVGEDSFYAQSRGVLRRTSEGLNCFSVFSGSGPTVKIETIQIGQSVTVKSNNDNDNGAQYLTVKDLTPYSLYSFRIRALNSVGVSSWSEPSTPIRTLHHLGPNGFIPLDIDATHSSSLLHNINKELVWMESAQSNGQAANTIDPDYAFGVGRGGRAGGDGGSGLAVISVYVSGQSESSRSVYFHSGKPETFTVPFSTVNGVVVDSAVLRLWGGGGGGAFNSAIYGNESTIGGGGAFVEMKLQVKSGERLKITVGAGGLGVNANGGGASTYGGGGAGGYGDQGGGGSGGGATAVYKLTTQETTKEDLVAIAAGGGGAGTSIVCCSDGGGASGGSASGNEIQGEGNGRGPSSGEEPLAVAGSVANVGVGGKGGSSGALEISVDGSTSSAHQQRGSDLPTLSGSKVSHHPSNGDFLRGGKGGDGVKGGGGGGGGYYGGGGGGGGSEASGGGGGISWVNTDAVYKTEAQKSSNYFSLSPNAPLPPVLLYVNASMILIGWDMGEMNVYGQEPLGYEVETSMGMTNESFSRIAYQPSTEPRLIAIENLLPETTLRVRVRAVTRTSFGFFSYPLTATTSTAPSNSWERIWPLRNKAVFEGFGVAAPVLGRPHMSTNTQDPLTKSFDPIGPREDHTRAVDGPTSREAVAPSPRRGHTLTLLARKLFLFGGLTTGYTCSAAMTDTNRYGEFSAGIAVDQCNYLQGENSELWSYDMLTNQWVYLRPGIGRWLEKSNTEYSASNSFLNVTIPPPREQHSSNAISNKKMIIFGGSVSNSENFSPQQYSQDASTNPLKRIHFNDLWELDIGEVYSFTERPSSLNYTNWSIPQGGFVFIPIQVNESVHIQEPHRTATDMCIVDVDVSVSVRHPCTRQLELVLFGPGPHTHDFNHEPSSHAYSVQLFQHHDGTGAGCGRNLDETIFDDSSDVLISECCNSPFTGSFKPIEKLDVFNGLRAGGEWVLGAIDSDVDEKKGEILDVELRFMVKECSPTVYWRELEVSSTNEDKPAARSQHAAVHVEDSLFVFGGYTSVTGSSASSTKSSRNTVLLHDIWRFDLKSSIWTQLSAPSSSSSPSSTSTRYGSSQYRHMQLGQEITGRSAILSPYGLILMGGLSSFSKEYDVEKTHDQIWRMDIWNENYEMVNISIPQSQSRIPISIKEGVEPHLYRNIGKLSGLGEPYPFIEELSLNTGRYLSSIAWVDDYSSISEKNDINQYDYLTTKDQNMMKRKNLDLYNNPSIYIFGGQDKGRKQLDDLRKLNLAGLASEPFIEQTSVNKKKNIINKKQSLSTIKSSHCDWWMLPNSTSNLFWEASCLSTQLSQNCTLPLVLRRAWCSGEFQSVGFL